MIASLNGPTSGANPWGALVQGIDGNLYGTTQSGGAYGQGTVFKITPSGRITTLYSFCARQNCVDGASPKTGLALGMNGDLFGSTQVGGIRNLGTIFRITSSGKFTTLHSFCVDSCSDGAQPGPYNALLLGSDGDFYGTASFGGAGNNGTVFKITRTGAFTTLYAFCTTSFNCADGAYPFSGLVEGTDGNYYGTTSIGGTASWGTAFQITPSGTLNTLYSFCLQGACSDGADPVASLMQAGNGNFYGTTISGGSNREGVIFSLTPPELTFNTIYSFCNGTNCPDGASPHASLIQGTDGNLYGTTKDGGTAGNIFQITPAGALTDLHSFDVTDGSLPESSLLQATSGIFYGTTNAGGSFEDGVAYSLNMGLKPFVTFIRASGQVGQTCGILGQGFTGASSVSFKGVPAHFIVKSGTYIVARIPSGATTGPVTVTTSTGVLTSNVNFAIR